MLDIKDEFNLIKPKYLNNANFVFVSRSGISYKTDSNVLIEHVKDFGNVSDFLVRVADIPKFDLSVHAIGVNPDVPPLYKVREDGLSFSQICISKEMFDFFNTIVSCGVTPLDTGIIACKNGILTFRYFNLEYSIESNFVIENKMLELGSYINFDLIWYLYVLYKTYASKKEKFLIDVAVTSAGYVMKYNNIKISHNCSSVHKVFVKNLCIQFENIISTLDANNVNLMSKKYVCDNGPTIYKNVTKCMGDNVNIYSLDRCDVFVYQGINAILAKVRPDE